MRRRHPAILGLPIVVLVCSLLHEAGQAQFAQQGPKLVGTGAVGAASQGYSVSLSDDGNTAIVGGPRNNPYQSGAAWVFTLSGGVWSQRQEINPCDNPVCFFPFDFFGVSVSLSGDGDTAIVGALDVLHDEWGYAEVYVRSGGYGPHRRF